MNENVVRREGDRVVLEIGPAYGMGGAKLLVALVDYDRRDDDGKPSVYQSAHHLTNRKLARQARPDFLESSYEHAAASVLAAFRRGDDEVEP